MADLLRLAQMHIRLDNESEVELVSFYLEAAKGYVKSFCEWLDADDDTYFNNAQVISAILMMTTDLFTTRCAQTDVMMYENKAIKRMLMPLKSTIVS